MEKAEGVLVADVAADSPAALAGIRRADVVTAVGGRAMEDGRSLAREIGAMEPGDHVVVTVVREGEPLDIAVRLAGWPDAGTRAGRRCPGAGFGLRTPARSAPGATGRPARDRRRAARQPGGEGEAAARRRAAQRRQRARRGERRRAAGPPQGGRRRSRAWRCCSSSGAGSRASWRCASRSHSLPGARRTGEAAPGTGGDLFEAIRPCSGPGVRDRSQPRTSRP